MITPEEPKPIIQSYNFVLADYNYARECVEYFVAQRSFTSYNNGGRFTNLGGKQRHDEPQTGIYTAKREVLEEAMFSPIKISSETYTYEQDIHDYRGAEVARYRATHFLGRVAGGYRAPRLSPEHIGGYWGSMSEVLKLDLTDSTREAISNLGPLVSKNMFEYSVKNTLDLRPYDLAEIA